MDKAELQQKIGEAFAEVAYPGDDRLSAPDARDDGETLTEFSRGQDWRDQNPDELWPDALYFMTPEAYRYYFPAYLLAALKIGSDDVSGVLHSRITPSPPADASFNEFQQRYLLFTTEQKETVRDYLSWLLDTSTAYRLKKRLHQTIQERNLIHLHDFWRDYANASTVAEQVALSEQFHRACSPLRSNGR